MNEDIHCHVCGASGIEFVPGFEALYRVTSDCRPWPKGGRLGVCPTCGCVQKPIDPAWRSEIEKIYQSYSIYHQADGAEQAVFEPITGAAASRSSHLLKQLRARVQLPKSGRLLDIGCGNGAFLRALSDALPAWSLAGTELSDKYRAVIERIHGVEALYTCPPEEVPGRFDLISMVHVLEHIPGPRGILVSLRDKLPADGLLLIEVPNYSRNPFDLLIADHSSHFSAATISWIVQDAGYEPLSVASDWVPKEITVVARKAQWTKANIDADSSPLQSLSSCIHWLEAVASGARRFAEDGALGLFGTSIAATWLASELEGKASFFVDEDPSRIGRKYMDRPVYHPEAVPSGSRVLVALPPGFSKNLKTRLLRYAKDYELCLPPAYPGAER